MRGPPSTGRSWRDSLPPEVADVVIRDVDPQGVDALALLNEASVDARALYPELFAGTTGSATNEPLVERGVYVVAYVDERPLACGRCGRSTGRPPNFGACTCIGTIGATVWRVR